LLGRLGLIYAERGDAKRARRVLEPLAGSADIEVLNALGIARAGDGDRPGTLEAFHRAIAIDARNATAYQHLRIAEVTFGKPAEALSALEKALTLNERLPRAWNAEGVALERSGKPAEALGAWQKAVAIDPQQYDAFFNIGLVAGQLQRYD